MRKERTVEELKEYSRRCTPEAWHHITDKLIDDLLSIGWDGKLIQVKEKFGSLNFYTGEATEPMFDLIDQAGINSTKICIVCGAPATCTSKGWYTHRCDEHKEGGY